MLHQMVHNLQVIAGQCKMHNLQQSPLHNSKTADFFNWIVLTLPSLRYNRSINWVILSDIQHTDFHDNWTEVIDNGNNTTCMQT